jgi:predicted small secreted protein
MCLNKGLVSSVTEADCGRWPDVEYRNFPFPVVRKENIWFKLFICRLTGVDVMMIKLFNRLLIVVLSCLVFSACAELEEAGRDIGHGTRDAAKAIGHVL